MTTESRKAYLACISREEHKVRQQLAYMRGQMKRYKEVVNTNMHEMDKSTEIIKYYINREATNAAQKEAKYANYCGEAATKAKAKVNGIKVVIMALKKQLPMKVRQVRVTLSDGEKPDGSDAHVVGGLLPILTFCHIATSAGNE